MALGLEDLNQSINQNQVEDFGQKKRVLRPWEGYEKLGNQTRTIAAREAVKKARKIVQDNEVMTNELRKGSVSDKVLHNLEEEHNEKEKMFVIDEEMIPIVQKVKNRSSIISFFKNMIN